MADWQRRLDLSDLWDKHNKEEMSTQAVAASVADRLEMLTPFEDSYINMVKEDIIESFKDMSNDPSSEDEDFNYLMSELYNWADLSLDNKFAGKKVCWIKTF